MRIRMFAAAFALLVVVAHTSGCLCCYPCLDPTAGFAVPPNTPTQAQLAAEVAPAKAAAAVRY